MNLLRLNKQSFGSAQIWASQTGLLSCVDLIMNHLAGKPDFKKLTRSEIKLKSNDVRGIAEYLDSIDVSYNIRDAYYGRVTYKQNKNSNVPMSWYSLSNKTQTLL